MTLVDVITDGRECGGKWECRYPASSVFGTIEIKGGGPESTLDFAVDTGFNGDLQDHVQNSINFLIWPLKTFSTDLRH